MKREDILNEMGGVNERYAAESKPRGRRNGTRRIIAWAAAAAAVFAAVFGGYLGVKAIIDKSNERIAAVYPTAAPTELGDPGATVISTRTPSGEFVPRAYALASYPETPGFDNGYYNFLNGLRTNGTMDCGLGLNDFYCRLAGDLLLTEKPGENAVCSPFNVYMALAMLSEITDGETRAQLLGLLGSDSISALREQYAKVFEANYRNSEGIAVTIPAASIWLDKDIVYNTDAVEHLSSDYRASVFGGEMGDPAYDALIKQWLDEQTHGLLKDKTDKAAKTDPTEIIKLISTLYFKAKWSDKFNAETKEKPFHSANGDQTVEFMSGTANDFVDCGSYILVGKALQDGSKMWFALPNEGVSLESVIESGALSKILDQRPDEYDNRVYLNMPKLDVAMSASLIGSLKRLGITDCFDPFKADFTPLTDVPSLFVSSVEHGARLIADADGVEAAAFTAIDVNAVGLITITRTVTLDRPFMFAVVSADHAPLFVGTVYGF